MLKGSIVALVTPFTKAGQIDEKKLCKLIDWHIKNKTDGILVCGTTGESATLTHDEHKQIIALAAKHINKRVPLLAGAGSNSTAEALELTLFAQKAKADAALVITPYYNKPTQEGLFRHYKKISSLTNIPIVMYNVPSRTGINILPETVARVYKQCKNVIGIKEASGSMDQVTKIMTLVDNKFVLLSGCDEITVPMMSVGCRGVVSVVANILPKQTHMMVESFLKNDIRKARKLQLQLYPIIKSLFLETNPIPAKTALNLMGHLGPYMRLPLYPMSAANLMAFKKVLKTYKLI